MNDWCWAMLPFDIVHTLKEGVFLMNTSTRPKRIARCLLVTLSMSVLLCTTPLVVGCSIAGNNSAFSSELVGTWIKEDGKATMTFNEDGTCENVEKPFLAGTEVDFGETVSYAIGDDRTITITDADGDTVDIPYSPSSVSAVREGDAYFVNDGTLIWGKYRYEKQQQQ